MKLSFNTSNFQFLFLLFASDSRCPICYMYVKSLFVGLILLLLPHLKFLLGFSDLKFLSPINFLSVWLSSSIYILFCFGLVSKNEEEEEEKENPHQIEPIDVYLSLVWANHEIELRNAPLMWNFFFQHWVLFYWFHEISKCWRTLFCLVGGKLKERKGNLPFQVWPYLEMPYFSVSFPQFLSHLDNFFFFVLHFLNTQMQDWEFQIHVEFCFHGVPCLISLLICFSLLLITFVIAWPSLLLINHSFSGAIVESSLFEWIPPSSVVPLLECKPNNYSSYFC